ncbi:hypothetical protein GCM10010218_34930 [Streptomyces mashuensis]|uniref:Uncharacterized protein n=1 Tax=Streptomyces mashuensis TaxID=33904 RepID=A0A919B595_9ACTN|nr:hypothetical protein GCM10010218_34930 [Streptomyces mashuensis]
MAALVLLPVPVLCDTVRPDLVAHVPPVDERPHRPVDVGARTEGENADAGGIHPAIMDNPAMTEAHGVRPPRALRTAYGTRWFATSVMLDSNGGAWSVAAIGTTTS